MLKLRLLHLLRTYGSVLIIGLTLSLGLVAETLPPAMLTSLPPGYSQTLIESFSQTCTTFLANCVTTGGAPLIPHGGGSLDRAGNTFYTASHFGINILNEHGGIGPETVDQFTTLSNTASCTVNGTEALITYRILWFNSFNDVLNVMHVMTTSYRIAYSNITQPFWPTYVPPTCIDDGTGIYRLGGNLPGVGSTYNYDQLIDVTQALVRITGPFPQGNHKKDQN
jgi:hypothetical protein